LLNPHVSLTSGTRTRDLILGWNADRADPGSKAGDADAVGGTSGTALARDGQQSAVVSSRLWAANWRRLPT